MLDYDSFLDSKSHLAKPAGFTGEIPSFLFPFQGNLLEWSLQMGRSLLLADCGLGKTPIALSWADNVCRHADGRVLILTPLAVAAQFEAEGAKFGIPCHRSRDGAPAGRITVTNYERLGSFSASDYVGVVCDESSCIKNFTGKRRGAVTEFLREIPYRLLDSATAAPNDYRELGCASEALGYLGLIDMMAEYFTNDENSLHPTSLGARWRFKRAAEKPFWQWVVSWARAIRKPSDIGAFDDAAFTLPPLSVRERYVENVGSPEGFLPGIVIEAHTLEEQRDERRRNLRQRCELAADLALSEDSPVVIWTDYNAEADLLERLISGSRQISGAMPDALKETRFQSFQDGSLMRLITKPKIGAWGLNWQHCHRVIFFVSHSFEQYYQAIRRCWRFGQERPVTVDVIATPGERRVVANLQSKAQRAEAMFGWLVQLMNDPQYRNRFTDYRLRTEIPPWLMSKLNS